MDRRTFLKAAAGAGLALTIPAVVVAEPRMGRIESVRYIETDVEVIIQAAPSPFDPLAQRIGLGWKARGSDGIQYGQYIEFSDSMLSMLGDNVRITENFRDWAVESMGDVPALTHLTVPSLETINEHLTAALSR